MGYFVRGLRKQTMSEKCVRRDVLGKLASPEVPLIATVSWRFREVDGVVLLKAQPSGKPGSESQPKGRG